MVQEVHNVDRCAAVAKGGRKEDMLSNDPSNDRNKLRRDSWKEMYKKMYINM